jgi:hypothetical protein
VEIPVSSLALNTTLDQSEPWSASIPDGVEQLPPELVDPFEDDDAPELPLGAEFEPTEEDSNWNAENSPANADGFAVAGEPDLGDPYYRTASALEWWREHCDPGQEPEPTPSEYCLF